MLSDFQSRLSRIDNILLQLLDRVDEFLESTLRITQLGSLLQGSALQRKFEKDVVSDFNIKIEGTYIVHVFGFLFLMSYAVLLLLFRSSERTHGLVCGEE
jgi:hypothetical protein